MKTLNDKILVNVRFAPQTTYNNYVYTVTDAETGQQLFQGTVYVPKSSIYQTIPICLNDIIKSEVIPFDYLDSYNANTYRPIRKFTVRINGTDYLSEDIYLGYDNLFHNYSMDIMKSETECATTYNKHFSMMLQGATYNYKSVTDQSYQMLPKYPFIATDNLSVAQLFNSGSSFGSFDYGLSNGKEPINIGTMVRNEYIDNLSVKLSRLLNNQTYMKYMAMTNSLFDKPINIAEFDKCPAKYYLQWIDRFGGVQCQPFDGKNINSINYDTKTINNRYDEKRPVYLNNTYNFEINTKWLNEKDYALYESIFVSPILKLYDTELDKSYRVIITDKTFTEKTFNNQKKLFGLTLKLQINTTENIIY